MDGNQKNHSFLEQHFGGFDGSAFSNQTVLEESIQSLLERDDAAEAGMMLYHLNEDVPVPSVGNERVKLLRNEVQ